MRCNFLSTEQGGYELSPKPRYFSLAHLPAIDARNKQGFGPKRLTTYTLISRSRRICCFFQRRISPAVSLFS